MEQLAVVARLKKGAGPRAHELIASGVPFDPAEEGLARHTVFISSEEVLFVFEGHEVEWVVDKMVTEPFRYSISDALEAWQPIIDGEPRIAQVAYSWERESSSARRSK